MAAAAGDIHCSNFEIYSSASEGSTRETLRYFEQVRSFFLPATGRSVSKPVPIYIIAFGSEKEYVSFRPTEFASAFYHGGAEHDYITLSRTASETFPVRTYEYVHLVVQHAGLNFPPWLSEGIAELYSTLKPQGDKVVVGNLIAGRAQALYTEKWVPLAVILSAGHDSAYHNERNKAGSLYNEAWALVHTLALNQEYRAKFNALLNAIANGSPSIMAFEQTYGKPLATIEKDLQAYLRGGRFNGLVIPAKLVSERTALPAEPAPPFDVKLALADLCNQPGKQSDAVERFKELTRDNPERPEPWAGLAYLPWGRGRMEDTEQNFAKAYLLGARSQRLLWDCGRLAKREHPQEAIKVERPSQAATGANRRANQSVGRRTRNPRSHQEDYSPRCAAAVYLACIRAAWRAPAGPGGQQRRSSCAIRGDAGGPGSCRLKRYLDQPNPPVLIPSTVTEGGRPRLVRRTAAGFEEEKIATPSRSATGSFVEVACEGAACATIVLETDQGRKRFLLEDPTKVTLVAADGAHVQDFQCGPPTPAKIKIEYRLAKGGQNIDGLATGVCFQP